MPYRGFHVVRYQSSIVIMHATHEDSQQPITAIDCEDSFQSKTLPWHEQRIL